MTEIGYYSILISLFLSVYCGLALTIGIKNRRAIILSLKPDSDQLADWANVLFDQAALSEGAHLVEPAAYVKRVNNLLTGILPGGGSRIITDV